MSVPPSASRPGDASVRWRLVWGWGAFFALVIVGLVLFWRFGATSPVLHDVGSPR